MDCCRAARVFVEAKPANQNLLRAFCLWWWARFERWRALPVCLQRLWATGHGASNYGCCRYSLWAQASRAWSSSPTQHRQVYRPAETNIIPGYIYLIKLMNWTSVYRKRSKRGSTLYPGPILRYRSCFPFFRSTGDSRLALSGWSLIISLKTSSPAGLKYEP